MRLFTHNLLQCHVKGCTKDNYPLSLTDVEIEELDSDFNEEFIRNYLPKLDYPAILETVKMVRQDGLPFLF